ncbi:LpxL/LpxP family Kdo(2)-lipid IV(A) lauroyl/palmitoleoyl acyltransferase [Catenovulum sp. SM1970]|uniref:LpxL/LpxP family Kdo(2)-lipid IV(A) lauroyl/palmitoleoyl acyltransferase n=1 Tax=Marinifaba aquimaris TaxID=2741323 RepID=UPI001574C683|nr:LpxL/LpxP family Kdo(2)-lipid IV(A) lauroyl/palmitoleoyl acyltransferase [Marinifaba aquimaris]NTS77686.1 LpxL/LpxP family Kdo(2)-lipid IV(A) lauroyl/palmitoleoyl acyltransferase [Marinifaba aquimaris]
MQAPQFSFAFLAPKYWLNWLGLACLYLISWLPYKLQLKLGCLLGLFLYCFFKRRVKIAQVNVKMCFPDMPEAQREAMVRDNFKSTGIAFFESGMAWWWPSWRVKKLAKVEGVENIIKAKESGKGVLVVAHHMLCMEMCNRIVGLHNPNIGFYRPHNNALMEYIQYRGRMRDNRYQIGKKDIRGLYRALGENESVIYLPDQDYGRRKAVFVPFFAEQKACTTTGTSMIARDSGCQLVITTAYRNKDNSGYTIKFDGPLEGYPSGDDTEDATRINKMMTDRILVAPEQYMWLHRRFKTREDKKKGEVYE